MLRRRWKLLTALTVVGLLLGAFLAVQASGDDDEVAVVFYAANHRLLVDPASPNALTPERTNETAKVLMRIEQPWYNHNGGQIEFGPDGYLYIGSGDGG